MAEPVISYLRWRVVKTFNAGNAEVTNDLPTLRRAHIEVVAFQPGNPGSSALGSFSIQLHPPGSEGYAAAKAIYDQLDYFQRVEAYISHDGASLGRLYYAGIVTSIRKSYGTNPRFELTGHSDIVLANLSKPFPGEQLSINYQSGLSNNATYRQARNYFGSNEVGFTDTFNPFTIGNYTSTNIPGLTAGTWTGTTDDGLNVASCATGTGAALLSKTGATFGDKRDTQFVEISGRLLPSSDATNAGKFGVGLSTSNANLNNATVVYVTSKLSGSDWNLDVHVDDYVAGALTNTLTVGNALTVASDPENFIPITISYLVTQAQWSAVVVNGKVVLNQTNFSSQPFTVFSSTAYPFLFFGTPATGAATAYETNLVQMVRFTDDQNANVALFKSGTIGSPSHSLKFGTDPGPTFLEVWSRCATREGWYWRYTPQAYAVGTRTIGTIDLTTDPGTDRGTNKSVVFSRLDGTLVSLELTANGDQFVAGTTAAGPPGTDGGGLSYWRDIGTMTKYGVIEDQILSVTQPNYTELRRNALNVQNNRLNLSSAGSKTAVVLRDPQTADVWRELDKVMIHDPELGINYLVARVMAYTFDEGQPTQTLTLDQFSADDPTLLGKRLQTGVFQTAAKFSTR